MKATRVFLLPVLACLLASSCRGVDGSGDSGTPAGASWQRESANPLILQKLTSTELDYGPADPTALFDRENDLWKVWFSSTIKDLDSGDEVMTIKYAESANGTDWSEPVVAFQTSADTLAWDHTHVETPAVIRNPDPAAPADRTFLLWYSGANTVLASS
jgi:hypothetical protein